ncbi:hypothetical protein, partial [Escherichia coli]|uniref:hypothetical protein n=1 Tax=Escherichia coli TaxID=562 RepID=UPI0019802B08
TPLNQAQNFALQSDSARLKALVDELELAQLSANNRQELGSGDPLLCTDQPGSGFRCGRDSGHRDCLHGRMASPAGAGDASDLEQTLHYAGTD